MRFIVDKATSEVVTFIPGLAVEHEFVEKLLGKRDAIILRRKRMNGEKGKTVALSVENLPPKEGK